MRVVQFLRDGGTLETLTARYAIKARRHEVFPNLVLLKYNQIDSLFSEPIVRECRGVVLDEADGWRVVSRSFDKFFNYGEGHAASIDWPTARVQEKLDGSLCSVYWYGGGWHVATTGTPDGSGPVGSLDLCFADLFWRTLGRDNLDHIPDARGRTFMFELCTPHNRVIVPHRESRAVLLSVRDLDTMQEERPGNYADFFPVVREFPLGSFEEALATFATIDPLRQEGYVVVDGHFNRVKVKHPGYVAIHHLKGEGVPTPKRFLEIARTGEGSELLAHFPEWASDYEAVKAKYEALADELGRQFREISATSTTQKEFALKATKTRCSAALFAVRAGKSETVRGFLSSMRIENLASALGLNEPTATTEAA